MTETSPKYSIEVNDDITVISVWGSLSYDDAKFLLSKLAMENIYHFRCIDVSRVNITYTKEEVMGLSDHSKSIYKDNNRSAIIVGDDLAYGIIRSLIAYREEDAHMKMNVFRSVNKGVSWLKQQKELLQELNQD